MPDKINSDRLDRRFPSDIRESRLEHFVDLEPLRIEVENLSDSEPREICQYERSVSLRLGGMDEFLNVIVTNRCREENYPVTLGV